ncbi:MAG: hypothetical protein ACOYUZ_06595 [Patescibacteria group bacterium]
MKSTADEKYDHHELREIEDLAERHIKINYYDTLVQRHEFLFIIIAVQLFSIILVSVIGKVSYFSIKDSVEIGYFTAFFIAGSAFIIALLRIVVCRLLKIPAASFLEKAVLWLKFIAIIGAGIYTSHEFYDEILDLIVNITYETNIHPEVNAYFRSSIIYFLPLLVIVFSIRYFLAGMGWLPKLMWPIGLYKHIVYKTSWGSLEAYLLDTISDFQENGITLLDDLILISHLAILRLRRIINSAKPGAADQNSMIELKKAQDLLITWHELRISMEKSRDNIFRFCNDADKRAKTLNGSAEIESPERADEETKRANEMYAGYTRDINATTAAEILNNINAIQGLISETHAQMDIKTQTKKLPMADLEEIRVLGERISRILEIESLLSGQPLTGPR